MNMSKINYHSSDDDNCKNETYIIVIFHLSNAINIFNCYMHSNLHMCFFTFPLQTSIWSTDNNTLSLSLSLLLILSDIIFEEPCSFSFILRRSATAFHELASLSLHKAKYPTLSLFFEVVIYNLMKSTRAKIQYLYPFFVNIF